mmetsp:Transcript_23788/g.59702  ORF Transcript_23788/g.59702 Transcript_23788/m.59702 type:complete len:200 (-) Transcript_23788:166-765(-)
MSTMPHPTTARRPRGGAMWRRPPPTASGRPIAHPSGHPTSALWRRGHPISAPVRIFWRQYFLSTGTRRGHPSSALSTGTRRWRRTLRAPRSVRGVSARWEASKRARLEVLGSRGGSCDRSLSWTLRSLIMPRFVRLGFLEVLRPWTLDLAQGVYCFKAASEKDDNVVEAEDELDCLREFDFNVSLNLQRIRGSRSSVLI